MARRNDADSIERLRRAMENLSRSIEQQGTSRRQFVAPGQQGEFQGGAGYPNTGDMPERLVRLGLRRTGNADVSASYGQAGVAGVLTTLAIRGVQQAGQAAATLTNTSLTPGERSMGLMKQTTNIATFGLGTPFLESAMNLGGVDNAISAEKMLQGQMRSDAVTAATLGVPMTKDQLSQRWEAMRPLGRSVRKTLTDLDVVIGSSRSEAGERASSTLRALGDIEHEAFGTGGASAKAAAKLMDTFNELTKEAARAKEALSALADLKEKIGGPR